jgi:hypothetical protein
MPLYCGRDRLRTPKAAGEAGLEPTIKWFGNRLKGEDLLTPMIIGGLSDAYRCPNPHGVDG